MLTEKGSYVLEMPFEAGSIQTGFVGAPGSLSVVYANHVLNLGAVRCDAVFRFGKVKPVALSLSVEGEAGSRYWSSSATLELGKRF